jgi:hypothetical protein
MKKLSLLLIAIFSLLAFNNANAQNCPSGWSQGTTYVEYSGCTFTVHYCYYCTTSTYMEAEFDFIEAQNATCNNVLSANLPAILALAQSAIYQAAHKECEVPPCGQGLSKKSLIVKVPNCVKKRLTNLSPFGSGYHLQMDFCRTETYCVTVYKYCIDYSQNPPVVIPELISKTLIGSQNCTGTEPTEAWLFDPMNLNIWSECYLLPNGCE